MAIKISGTTVIDDSRNLVSVGVATIGSGNSAVILNGNSGIVRVGSGITINGNTGDINISGILTVAQLSVPIKISSFDPPNGSTTVGLTSNIILNFNQTVGLGTTGLFTIRTGLNTTGGTTVESYGVGSTNIRLTGGGKQLVIDPTNQLAFSSGFSITMDNGYIVSNDNRFAGINVVGAGLSYSFTTRTVQPGDFFGGGYLLCQSGGTRWVVAPSSSQVNRNFNAIGDSNTVAQQVSGCAGWFVPSCAQLQNPGSVCKSFWDSCSGTFWSSTQYSGFSARAVIVSTGGVVTPPLGCVLQVRSFRCVTY